MDDILFGMPTLIECDSLEQCVYLCNSLGLDFIEINMNMPQYQQCNMDIENMREMMKNKNIFFTLHLDENLNICDFNEAVSKAYLETVRSTIEISKELKIPIINMHMAKGVYFTLPSKKIYLFEKYKKIYLEKLLSFRELCTDLIGEEDIKICIENTNGYEAFQEEGIELLLESKVFALTYDIGHDHSIGGKDSAFVRRNIDRLIHMHVHDATANKNHLALGTGEIDVASKLNLAKENNCRCVLETKTVEGLKQSVKYINSYF
ncbi:sugar phosphate isomerase/epimerase family protein [Clostridium manihotivorum]|uniref:Sugar phosphate isomerase/epimerase n=1 Tax=Clostridium manihotivorum TaxID=2320868 RepID=A0A3R5X5N0_9CLOT|nr:sugar phosphate isomerase/epimerase family protein [Clostridium manihotivorum]QAA35327.1 sugar phosphate isomerase/epimerase [Clostridium manihotivorum]